MENIEKWNKIENFENYEASTFGNIRKLCNKKLIKQGNNGFGYLRVSLNNGEKFKTILTHVVIAISFLNHKPNKTNEIVVDHIDKNKTNNSLNNLRLVTNRENLSRYENKSSKYTGVHYHSRNKKWNSNIWHNKKKVFLGTFINEIDAHLAYQKYLKENILC